MGTLPQSGSVMFRLTFRPSTNERGEVTAFGAPADVFLEDASGLGEPDVEHLERCGGTAGYGLPMEHMSVLPRVPEAVVFLMVRFPVDRDSFPYKLLREGQDEITHP